MAQPAETRMRVGGVQPTQILAALVGIAYLGLGIWGLTVTGFGDFIDPVGASIWVFSVNPLHNIVHLVVGVLGVAMAMNSGLSRTFGWFLFIVFGLLFVWGLAITGVFASNPVSGLGNPLAIGTADNWLHLGTALAGLLIAVMPARRVVETAGPASASPAVEEEPSRGHGGLRNRFSRRGTAH
ncbi:uncharacterized protein DUF4383 [Prauserella shujinwangii]|uniref:Uncharacterized protein DUF4383 n=1 Tax=Prauserella shujinwangii TaxID=1453103 RepID=A0A2T0LWS1_9PSEU|nr:DUF4383 domain-containing protein [Prauserella shujinwangii]PRX48472.1 uncharacterized protein DUF4383 [Prauserella shujinwangii]